MTNLEKAYDETIMDFEIEAANTGFFEFRRSRWIQKQIDHFKEIKRWE